MNVLSLFDGMSCGQLALQRAGVEVEKYYASEIDKHAIKVTQHNFPKTTQLGTVEQWQLWGIENDLDWASIDLIIAGSPCQGFSFAGKQLAFDDPRSKLFFTFVDILNHVRKHNPNVKFLLENVKMKKEFQDIITNILGVEPVFINSALVSAQNRRRLYWANWWFPQPEDKGVLLKDVVHENADVDRAKSLTLLASYGKCSGPADIKRYYTKSINQMVFEILNEFVVPFDKTLKILDAEVQKGKIGFFNVDSQAHRAYGIHGKAVTLCGDAGGGAAKMGRYLFGCITPDRINKRQNGQRFNSGLKFYTLTAQDQHGILVEGYIRKLTPTECERLQTVPESYTACTTKTQRYRMLGNGWTVDVIAHIFNFMDDLF